MDSPLKTPELRNPRPGEFHAASGCPNFELEPCVNADGAGSGGVGGVSAHERAPDAKEEWLTPPEIIRSCGAFDLDPCAPVVRPWEMAATHYTWRDNGLRKPWRGRVWLNPPYGNETSKWMGRLAEHGDGIALIFARTETETWFRHIWGKASAVLFLQGRLSFFNVDGTRGKNSAGGPSALIAYGDSNAAALRACGLAGYLVFDPFCGGGTTGIAAMQCGRRFEGYEGDPEYAALSKERIGNAHEPMRAFDTPPNDQADL